MPDEDLLLISPLFPPARGGLADHTKILAQKLASSYRVTVLTSLGAESDFSYSLSPFTKWHSRADLIEAARNHDGPILWQYDPQMYGRVGVNFAVPNAIRALAGRRRQVVIAHEVAAPMSPLPHRAVYSWSHRLQWQVIARNADSIGLSTEAWLSRFIGRHPKVANKSVLIPSPSNIPIEPVSPDHRAEWKRRRGWPPETRVLLYFGSISPLKQVPWIIEAWREALGQAPTALIIIGEELEIEASFEERRFLDTHSFLQSADVSRVLQVADVLALPFADGVSERRGSFMAGLSHGLAVVTTIGDATGPTLRKSDAFVAVPSDDHARFKAKTIELLGDEPHRRSLGERACATYERAYDWPHVISRLEALLSTKTESFVA